MDIVGQLGYSIVISDYLSERNWFRIIEIIGG